MKFAQFISQLEKPQTSNLTPTGSVVEGLNVSKKKNLDSLNQELSQTSSIGKKLDIIGKMILTGTGA